MDATERLKLIAEAVKYCQRVKKKGMPPACYTKALREPIHLLWERRIRASPDRICGPKVCAAKFRSKAARGLSFGNRELVYDHAIPFSYLQDKLLNLSDVSTDLIRKLLNKLCVPTLITEREHQLLSDRDYGKRMPNGWNGINALARYEAVGIEVEPNTCVSE